MSCNLCQKVGTVCLCVSSKKFDNESWRNVVDDITTFIDVVSNDIFVNAVAAILADNPINVSSEKQRFFVY